MKRAVCAVLRLIAAGLILFGALALALEFFRQRLPEAGLSLWRCFVGVLLVGLGGVLFALSARLAERFTDDFDE
jgi:TRAP-type C4-dicarboxylate transport system permease small subunit